MVFLLFLVLAGAVYGQSYTDSLIAARQHHDSTFLATVLNEKERENLHELCYFEPDANYIVTASFERIRGKKFAMPMTKARNKTVYYRKCGKLTFTLHDTVCELFVYENPDLKHRKGFEDYLFLPFKDGTSGKESYGGGRFIDLRMPKNGKLIIDFNTAYNPYCAYSERYSCPITPSENTLKVNVRAGSCYAGH